MSEYNDGGTGHEDHYQHEDQPGHDEPQWYDDHRLVPAHELIGHGEPFGDFPAFADPTSSESSEHDPNPWDHPGEPGHEYEPRPELS